MTPSAGHRQTLGQEGEHEAEDFLRALGMEILERRYRRRCGEVDLICAERVDPDQPDEIVFVEVKTRRGTGFGKPESAVSRSKRLRMVRTAAEYLHERALSDVLVRFDVVSIVRRSDRTSRIEHFRAAFGMHELKDLDPWT